MKNPGWLVLTLVGGCSAQPTPAPTPPTVETPAPAPTASPYSPGLEVKDVKVGEGPACKAGDKITVRYIGKLEDGSTFDENEKATFTIGVGVLIKGWDEGIPGMRVGGIRRLKVPAALAYGTKGSGKVPPFSDLYFEVALLAIET